MLKKTLQNIPRTLYNTKFSNTTALHSQKPNFIYNKATNLFPYYNTCLHSQNYRMFSNNPKGVDDFITPSASNEGQASGVDSMNPRQANQEGRSPEEEEAFDEDEKSFYNEKKSAIYFMTAASITQVACYFVQQVHAMRKDKKIMQQESNIREISLIFQV